MSQQRESTHSNKKIIVGLDLGTTRIDVVIAEIIEGSLKIIGVGDSPSEGLNNGVVVNIDRAVQSIRKAVEQAEMMCGFDVSDVFVGVSGNHIRGAASNAIVPIDSDGREITQRDIDLALENASVIQMPADYEIIHRIPMEYLVDKQGGVTNPIGMSGVRLEANVYVVMASRSVLDNVKKSVTRAGLNVAGIVLAPLASACAVLVDEQRELGVAVVDLGGGTTDITVYSDGAILHAVSISLGNIKVTDDLAYALHTAKANAEKIKIQYGACEISRVENQMVKIPGIARGEDREVPRSELVDIICPRVKEILGLVKIELARGEMDQQLGAGLVLTGGGAQLEGMKEYAEQFFKLPTQIGLPVGLSGVSNILSSPSRATGVGLVLYAHQVWKENGGSFLKEQPRSKGIFSVIWATLRRFF